MNRGDIQTKSWNFIAFSLYRNSIISHEAHCLHTYHSVPIPKIIGPHELLRTCHQERDQSYPRFFHAELTRPVETELTRKPEIREWILLTSVGARSPSTRHFLREIRFPRPGWYMQMGIQLVTTKFLVGPGLSTWPRLHVVRRLNQRKTSTCLSRSSPYVDSTGRGAVAVC